MTTSLLSAEYKGKGKIQLGDETNRPWVSGQLDFKWKVWTLVGEPVDMLTARWNIHKINFDGTGNSKLKNQKTGSYVYEVCKNKENGSCIPANIMAQSRIVNLKIYGFIKQNDSSIRARAYLFDAGVMAKPYAHNYQNKYGSWSYNTPGSPSWEKTFVKSMSNDLKIYDYLKPKTAKRLMKQGFKIDSYKIAELDLDLTAVKRYIIERNKQYDKSKIVKKAKKEKAHTQKQQKKSNDPFAALEGMYKEEVIEEKIQNSDSIINDQYASVDYSLSSEARTKSHILQMTKDRVDNRFVSSGNKTPKSYSISKTINISSNELSDYYEVEVQASLSSGLLISGLKKYAEEVHYLFISKSGKIVKLGSNVRHVYNHIKSAQLANGDFVVYNMHAGSDDFFNKYYIHRYDKNGRHVISYKIADYYNVNNPDPNVYSGPKGELILDEYAPGNRTGNIKKVVIGRNGNMIYTETIEDKEPPIWRTKKWNGTLKYLSTSKIDSIANRILMKIGDDEHWMDISKVTNKVGSEYYKKYTTYYNNTNNEVILYPSEYRKMNIYNDTPSFDIIFHILKPRY